MADPVQLSDLVGPHLLFGVDMPTTKVIHAWRPNEFEDVNAIRFQLETGTYLVAEDPDDGYRSSARDVVVDDSIPTNIWTPPQKVLCKMKGDGDYEKNDVLQMLNADTGEVILEVGTGNTADYYPYFVSEFDPTKLSHNLPKKE